jgi:hypothetical protein
MTFYKVLRNNLVHRGFRYKLGLNVDIQEFNPEGSGESGGLYYTDLEHIADFLSFGNLIAEVEPVGQIYVDPAGDRWKTDKLIIKNITPFYEWVSKQSEEVQLAAVNHDSDNFLYISNPSEKVRLAAVQSYGALIHYIDNPSEEVQMAAIGRNEDNIRFIKNPSKAVQLAAVKGDISSIQFIENQTEEFRLEAVAYDGYAITYMENPSEAVQLAAVSQTPCAILYIDNPTEKTKCLAMVKNRCLIPCIYVMSAVEAVKHAFCCKRKKE